MIFNNLSITAIAMVSLLLPAALATPEPSLESRGLDVRLKWHATGSCNGGGGPARDYSAGACLDLPGTTKGVEILDRRPGCYRKSLSSSDSNGKEIGMYDDSLTDDMVVVSYDDGICKNGPRKLDSNGCKTLKGKRSVGFKC